MGVSTDAIIFYGHVWTEEDLDILEHLRDADGDDDGDKAEWPEIIARRRGHKNPWDDFVEPSGSLKYEERQRISEEWATAHEDERKAWYAATKAIETEFGVHIGRHCSGDYPMPYIAITGAGKRSWCGDANEVPNLEVGGDWNDKLQRFVSELGIDLSEAKGPAWWLVSYWG